MRTFNTTLAQRTYNRVCQQLDFTEKNGKSGRYVVGTLNLYKGINPSFEHPNASHTEKLDIRNLQSLITTAIEDGEAVGGWMDTNTGVYYVDVVAMTDEKHVAQTLGAENGELCIWDSQEEKTVDIYGKSSPSEPDGYPYQDGDNYWYEAVDLFGGRSIKHGTWDAYAKRSHDINRGQKYYTASEVLQKAREVGIECKSSPSEPDGYPYQNGDGYWYEMGNEIVFAYWDIASECSHDRNPFQKYYTLSEVVEIARKSSIKIIT